MIPNAPSIIGKGYNPMSCGASLTEQDRIALFELMSGLGQTPEVAENELEIYAVLTAMGPTYLWPQLYELQSLAESFGLGSTEAWEALLAMVQGTLATMTDAGLSGEQVQDLIPVKPLGDVQVSWLEAYRTRLSALLEKIRP
jgi:pyrroline-5-carboxylate reductase